MLNTIKDFYKQRYLRLEDDLLINISNYCIENQDSLKDDFIGFVQDEVELMKNRNVIVSRIHFSILYTSFLSDETGIQLYFFDEHGEKKEGKLWECLWLQELWRYFIQEVTDEQYYIRSRIRSTMIKHYYTGSIRKILFLLGEYIRIWLELEIRTIMLKVFTTDELFITCGEGDVAEELLLWLRPPLNIIDYIGQKNLPENIFDYRYYSGGRYRCSKFDSMKMQNSQFVDCLFEPWKFINVDFRGAIFKNCRFNLVEFLQINLSGACFEKCTFNKCHFMDITGGIIISDKRFDYPMLFSECCFCNVTFVGCDLDDTNVVNCVFEQVTLLDCNVENITV